MSSNVSRHRGSPVVVLPILLLLAAGGVAALVGISLQPSAATEDTAPSISVSTGGSPTQEPVPTGACPSTAAIAPRPAAGDVAARTAWVSDTLNALADRVQCTTTIDGRVQPGWGARPEFANYTGIALDTRSGVLRVYWKGPVPQVVRERVGKVPDGVRVEFVTTAKYTSDQIDVGVGPLVAGTAVPPIAGRAADAPQLIVTSIDARENGSGIGMTYAYADGTLPPETEVGPADVARALETLTSGVTVFATPGKSAS